MIGIFRRRRSLGQVRLTAGYVGEQTGALARWERPGITRTAFDFLRVFDRVTLERLERVLAAPDPPDIHRGRLLKYEGAPDRYKRWLAARVRAIRAREIAAFGLSDEAVM